MQFAQSHSSISRPFTRVSGLQSNSDYDHDSDFVWYEWIRVIDKKEVQHQQQLRLQTHHNSPYSPVRMNPRQKE
jgi:hypothetical protein